ncbi:MAG: hypothetical protein H6779_00940 [Candidatus Nomurabacteria bacterium]|nr:hypothetical protein [Candidatus Nomurabacteria bacterium]USN87996.1 MAG: hypothetical protein H6779_00940 [Candidatus Nomurabacteria bacterium]
MKIQSIIFLSTFLLVAFGVSSSAYAETPLTAGVSDYRNQVETEKKVREYFVDIPDMIEIARCESNFRQYTNSGAVLRGGSGGQMIGVFQFNESIHLNTAKKLGFDINTLEDNLAYAKYVYDKQSTTPWISCLKNPVAPVVTSVNSNDKQGMVQPTREELEAKIKQLLQLLDLLQQLQKLLKLQAAS